MGSSIGFNPNKFIKGSNDYVDHSMDNTPVIAEEKPKRKRSKKNNETVPVVAASSSIAAPEMQPTNLNLLQSDLSYMTAYKETNEQLDSAIKELNMLGAEVMGELVNVRSSKTLKNKYNYINEMTGTITNIISTKVSAIKEKNKTINDVNNMELRRMKELKLDASKEDDTTRIMNLYDAFVNTPIGNYGANNPLGPSIADITVMGGAPNMGRVAIGNDQAAWEQGLDPSQNRMLLEAKGEIETIVCYDENSGNRWFDVVNIHTGQPVPNVEKPDDSYIWELDINTRGGFAKDPNRNITYKLVTINNPNIGMEGY